MQKEENKKNMVVTMGTFFVTMEGGFKETWIIVPLGEEDASFGKISLESPLAKAALGKGVGEVARFVAPDGDELVFKIISIGD